MLSFFIAGGKNLILLNVACGTGVEAELLVKLLKSNGWTNEEIKNCFYCLDVSLTFTNEMQKLGFNPDTIYTCDFLKWVAPTDQKTGTHMKFDLIIGNPPYQDVSNAAKNVKLWHSFTVIALSHLSPDGWIAFVTPSSIFKPHGEGGKLLKRVTEDLKLQDAKIHTTKMFSAGVETCHWVASRSAIGIAPPKKVLVGQSILDKIDNSNHPRLPLQMQNGWVTKDQLSAIGKPEEQIFFSGSHKKFTTEKLEGIGQLKLVFPFSCSYTSQFVTDKPLGMLNLFLPVESEVEANNIMSYTQTPAIRYFAKHYKKTSGFTPAVKNCRIPMLDSSRSWTADEVNAELGLTAEEIANLDE